MKRNRVKVEEIGEDLNDIKLKIDTLVKERVEYSSESSRFAGLVSQVDEDIRLLREEAEILLGTRKGRKPEPSPTKK